MTLSRMEALAMAIAAEHRSFESSSDAFQTLNPGLLKSYAHAKTYAHKRPEVVNGNGLRIFTSFQGGFRALVGNLTAKCLGQTRANGDKGHLCTTSTLTELCHTFPATNVRHIAEFLQDALDDRAINGRTPLSFFVDGGHQ